LPGFMQAGNKLYRRLNLFFAMSPEIPCLKILKSQTVKIYSTYHIRE